MKFTAFIADLHLEPAQPATFELFARFCREYAPKLDALYILGDLFVFWAGDDDLSDFNQSVINCLQGLVAQGVKIYLLPGNRDFLIGKQFADLSGCIVLKDPTKIELYNVPTLLTHGDLLCSKKHRIHIIFRAITGRKQFRQVFLASPLKWRRKLAHLVNAISSGRRYNKNKQRTVYCSQTGFQDTRSIDLKGLFKVNEKIMRRLISANNVQCMIHGHFHVGGVFPLLPADSNAVVSRISEDVQIESLTAFPTRIVLDEWTKNGGQALLCYPDHHCHFEKILPR